MMMISSRIHIHAIKLDYMVELEFRGDDLIPNGLQLLFHAAELAESHMGQSIWTENVTKGFIGCFEKN